MIEICKICGGFTTAEGRAMFPNLVHFHKGKGEQE